MAVRVMNSQNPYATLLAKLGGTVKPPSKARQGWQQFSKESYGDEMRMELEAAWDEEVRQGLQTGRHTAAFRQTFITGKYNALPEDEKKEIKKRASADKEAAVKQWKAEQDAPVSKDPASRQR